MTATSAPVKVLVSGANGFITVWVVKDLLDHGYAVRGAVRSKSKGEHLLKLFKNEVESGKFELVVVSDITAPGAFDEAVKGVDAIEHTASPLSFRVDDPEEIIAPAVKGTVGILESALKHAGPQFKRVVVTSSTAAIEDPTSKGMLSEKDWNEGDIVSVREKGRDATQVAKYRASKSLAEKAAWDFFRKHRSEITWDLTTICPSYVFGPVLHEVASSDALTGTAAMFYEAIFTTRKKPEELTPPEGPWVASATSRVRTCAHSRSLLQAVSASSSAQALSSGRTDDVGREAKIGGIKVPVGTPGAGKTFPYLTTLNSEKAKTVLKIEFRDKLATLRDTVEDFQARGW